jgi:hypothetical protein
VSPVSGGVSPPTQPARASATSMPRAKEDNTLRPFPKDRCESRRRFPGVNGTMLRERPMVSRRAAMAIKRRGGNGSNSPAFLKFREVGRLGRSSGDREARESLILKEQVEQATCKTQV